MKHPVTRRQVLAGITAAGAAGAVSGMGTAALLVDRETLAASVTSGRVELQVDTGSGPTDATNGPVEVVLPDLSPGDSGSLDLSFVLPDEPGVNPAYRVNPAYLWVRAGCAGPSALGEYLRLTVSRVDGAGETLFEGTYAEFLAAFETGVPLDASGQAREPGQQTCVDPGTMVDLRIDYELSSGFVGGADAAILFEGAAVQCRHVDPVDVPPEFDAPLGVEECLVNPCDCCVLVGKYEFPDDEQLAAGQYTFTEGSSAYLFDASDLVYNDEGETMAGRFRVALADDPTTFVDVCTVIVKSGQSVARFEGDDVDGVVGASDQNAISHVTMGICAPRFDSGECQENLVRDPSTSDGSPGNSAGGGGGGGAPPNGTGGKGGGQ